MHSVVENVTDFRVSFFCESRSNRYQTFASVPISTFFSACQKIVQQRLSASTSCLTPTNSRPSTPSNHFHSANVGIPRHVGPVPSNNGYPPSGQSSITNLMSSPSHNHTLSHKVSFAPSPASSPNLIFYFLGILQPWKQTSAHTLSLKPTLVQTIGEARPSFQARRRKVDLFLNPRQSRFLSSTRSTNRK